jgi:hypothetical protein
VKSILMALCGVLFISAAAYAQPVNNEDDCATYQHLSVALAANATPTAKLVTGQAGRTIYVCALHISQNVVGATPLITFYSGTGTTCGTGTVTEGAYSAGAAGTTNNIGTGATSMIVGVLGGDLCTVGNTTAVPQGSIEYVIR